MQKKKSFISTFFKVLGIMLLVILVILGGVAFYLYRTINNADQYNDIYIEDYEAKLKEYEDIRFEDYMTYYKDTSTFEYKMPMVLLCKYFTIESISNYLNLPEDFEIIRMGFEPDMKNKKIYVYLDVAYKNYIDSCLILETSFSQTSDYNTIELRYNDFYLINDYITELAKEKLNIRYNVNDLWYEQHIPSYIEYYQTPYFYGQYIYDMDYDGEYMIVKYDSDKAVMYYENNAGISSSQSRIGKVFPLVRQYQINYVE